MAMTTMMNKGMPTHASRTVMIRACVFVLMAAMLNGCGTYKLQGRVIRGVVADVQIVDSDDPRLNEPNPTGGGATIESILEPNTPSERKVLPRQVADGQGYFAVPVDAFGSGLLEYEAMLIIRRQNHQGTLKTIPLPRRGKRLLVTLPLGRDTLQVPERFLDGAIRDAKPYLDQKN